MKPTGRLAAVRALGPNALYELRADYTTDSALAEHLGLKRQALAELLKEPWIDRKAWEDARKLGRDRRKQQLLAVIEDARAEGITTKAIAYERFGTSRFIGGSLSRGVRLRKEAQTLEDTYGDWTVLSREGDNALCQCKCKLKKLIGISNLTSGRSKSCSACSALKRRNKGTGRTG